MKNCLIYETLNDVKTLTVKEEDGMMHLSGVFGVCGVKNNNKRVYEANNYAKMVKSMQDRIKKAPIPGELEHPQTMNITLENISHRIDSIQIDENGVVTGDITLLNTPKGQVAQAIVKGGLPLFISSRATGQVDQRTGMVTLENIATYDLVGSPGFSQAELHLNENQVAESICESVFFIGNKDAEGTEEVVENTENIENNIEENMNDELLQTIQEMKSKIESLEEVVNEYENNIHKLADGIEKWVVEEYSPEVQKWITDEYSNEIQKWIVEEYSPEVQKWITDEYSNEIQKWIVEEYSPEVQKWVVEEYSANLQNWLTEHFSADVENKITEAIKTKISTEKDARLKSLDEMLSMLESIDVKKPNYGRSVEMKNSPKYVQDMPEDMRPKYNMLSQDVKESINRRAKLYDFTEEGAVEKFWESIDFDSIKPVSSINEAKEVENTWEQKIRMRLRSGR